MGTANSKQRPNDDDNKERHRQRQQRERERLLREQGIFVPPFFAVGVEQADNNDTTTTTTTSTWWDSPSRVESKYFDVPTAAAQKEDASRMNGGSSISSIPASLSFVWQSQQEDASSRILQDYMTPGVWFQSVSNEATVLASLLLLSPQPERKNATISNNNNSKTTGNNNNKDGNDDPSSDQRIMTSKRGRLLVGRSFGNNDDSGHPVNLRLQGGTEGLPRLTSDVYVNDWLSVGMSANQEGQGWFNGKFSTVLGQRHTQNDNTTNNDETDKSAVAEKEAVRIEVATVLPWDLKSDKRGLLPSDDLAVTGRVGTGGQNGWTLAMDTNLNFETMKPQNTRLFGSVGLQEPATTGVSPVQLSLELNAKTSSVALTQRIAFDRLQLNIADDRVPYVRNTVGWTLRMEQPLTTSETADDKNASMSPKIILGGVWQLNRALAVKATIQDECLSGALICRRWKHPRVTCSFLGRYHWPSQTASLLGIGLEIETGRFIESGNTSNGLPDDSLPGKAPPTKVELPSSGRRG